MLLENKSEFISEEISNEEFISDTEVKGSDTEYQYNNNDKEEEEVYKDFKELRTEDEINHNGKFNLDKRKTDFGTDLSYKNEFVWVNVIAFAILHAIALYGIVLCFTHAKYVTLIYLFIMTHVLGLGITAAAHRLFAHRTYKVRLPLKILLLILHTATGEQCLHIWVRDHRLHHRYSDTDADPHNAQRGFFFSHIGWEIMKKHPLVKEMGKTIDLSDLNSDPWIMFQKNYYKTLHFIFGFVIPVFIPVYFWNEDFWVATITCYFTRYIYTLNVTWSLNSFAHTFGARSYDKSVHPRENTAIAIITLGEGWHNYHHTFPWDYRIGEWGGAWNVTSTFINWMHYIGQAYDLKKASPTMIQKRMERTGDGSDYKKLQLKRISKHL